MRTISIARPRLVAAIAGLNILLALGGWLLLVAPERHHAATAAQEIQQTQIELEQLQAAKEQALRAGHLPRIRTADLYRLSQAMPSTADEPDLLLALDQLAGSSGVKVLGLSPQTPTAAVGYTVLPIALNLSGSYAALTDFLHKLRGLVTIRHGTLVSSGRLFTVTSVGLTPGGAGKETAAVSVEAFAFGTLPGVTPLSTTPTGTTSTGTTSTTTTSGG